MGERIRAASASRVFPNPFAESKFLPIAKSPGLEFDRRIIYRLALESECRALISTPARSCFGHDIRKADP